MAAVASAQTALTPPSSSHGEGLTHQWDFSQRDRDVSSLLSFNDGCVR